MPRPVRRTESPRGYKMSSTSTTTPDMKSNWTTNQHLIDHGYGATPINQVMSSVTPHMAPAVKRKLNMETHHCVVPIKQEFKQPPPKRQRQRPTPVKKNARYDTSLNVLTQRFSALLEKAPNGVVDLNEASTKLAVQKRRIYDITNVLEGIGILEKKSKNNIQWKGSHENVMLSRRLKQLEDEENKLDKSIESTESQLRNLNNDRYGYVTYQDLQSIGRLKPKTVIAIKAPPNTHLSVPKGNDQNMFSIQIQSKVGEIEVFLCPETVSPIKPKIIPPMDPLLKDIKLSPGLLDIVTPPVPQLESPTSYSRPISSQICRNLSFNIGDASLTNSLPVQNPHQYNTSTTNSNSLMNNPLRLSPMNMVGYPTDHANSSTSKMGMPLIHDHGLGPMVGRYPGLQTDHPNSGSRDPLFCSEPFVSLEPLLQSEYQFSLDPNEGLSELFDLDLLYP